MQALSANSPNTDSFFPPGSTSELSLSDRLVRARLGPYAGLFYSLKAKHPPTAMHCLRVAIACSKWAIFRNLPSRLHEHLEIAGLMHDIGKIGIPDCVLQKPDALSRKEQVSMAMALDIGKEILSAVGASRELLDLIALARNPFDAQTPCSQAASMLKIVDAFDAMTNVQVFRPALSRERALEELCTKTGIQFDPELVHNFADFVLQPRPDLEQQVANRWLSELNADSGSAFSGMALTTGSRAVENSVDSLFHHRLLESLGDGAIYLDWQGKILSWNHAMEALSGRPAAGVLHCNWSPKLLGLVNEDDSPINQDNCPLLQSLKTCSKQSVRMKLIHHVSGKSVQVELSSIPLFSKQRSFTGFIILIHDDSRESDLVRRMETLHAIATQDPLTKVANRAELNRCLEELINEYTTTGVRGSLIMCDIDFFKRINDNYSHQAGDEALITFAALLRESARKYDLVARYGGEEFIILCQACDIGAAHARAEELRIKVERTPIPALNGSSLSSSFGVTELQPGDDVDTAIARADRALLTAKQTGRNRVVQMGAGNVAEIDETSSKAKLEVEKKRSSWLNWFSRNVEPIEVREYLSAVPIEVALQKLEGFVNDHKAELLSHSDSEISIRVLGGQGRRGECRIAMLLNVKIQHVQFSQAGRSRTYQNRTKFTVTIHPVKPRDRRQSVIEGQARQLILSFQAYIVGQEIDDKLQESIILPR